MPCLLGILAFFFPRFVIILLVLFGDYIGRAYTNDLWAVLGFFFAPFTTLAYAMAMNENSGSVSGIYLVLLVICVLLDLGVVGGGAKNRHRIKMPRKQG